MSTQHSPHTRGRGRPPGHLTLVANARMDLELAEENVRASFRQALRAADEAIREMHRVLTELGPVA